MSKITSLEKLLEEELKDIYNAEHQLLKALPKMAKKASAQSLKDAFEGHISETEGQIERLEKVGKILDVKLTGKTCKAMKGLIEEGNELMEEKVSNPAFMDLMLIGAAQRVEHYEISAYGTARTFAEQLGQSEVVELLQESLDEEAATDKKLSIISEDEILDEASTNAEEEEDEETSMSANR